MAELPGVACTDICKSVWSEARSLLVNEHQEIRVFAQVWVESNRSRMLV
jgi:hypothetical protein